MATILPFLKDGVFDPKDITAMSTALDDVCKELDLRDDSAAREVIAVRIIDLAKAGERSPTRLRDRVLQEAHMAQRVNLDDAREA
jgi:predicted Holliday junction resolvase-like endonuclease